MCRLCHNQYQNAFNAYKIESSHCRVGQRNKQRDGRFLFGFRWRSIQVKLHTNRFLIFDWLLNRHEFAIWCDVSFYLLRSLSNCALYAHNYQWYVAFTCHVHSNTNARVRHTHTHTHTSDRTDVKLRISFIYFNLSVYFHIKFNIRIISSCDIFLHKFRFLKRPHCTIWTKKYSKFDIGTDRVTILTAYDKR